MVGRVLALGYRGMVPLRFVADAPFADESSRRWHIRAGVKDVGWRLGGVLYTTAEVAEVVQCFGVGRHAAYGMGAVDLVTLRRRRAQAAAAEEQEGDVDAFWIP